MKHEHKIDLVIQDYSRVQMELFETFKFKISSYGTSRYFNHSSEFDHWMCFCDVHRKVLRLEELTKLSIGDSSLAESSREKLIDDYKDIANYAIMAVQILEKQNGVRTDSNS